MILPPLGKHLELLEPKGAPIRVSIVSALVRCKARWEGNARCEKVTGHAGNHKFLTPAKASKDSQ